MAELIQIAHGVSAVRFLIDKPQIHIGRGSKSDICLSDAYVSKEHAIIETRPSDQLPGIYEFYLRDLGSTNHTFINKTQIKYQKLKNNDLVQIGRNEFRFSCAEQDLTPNMSQGLNAQELMQQAASDPIEEKSNADEPSFSRRLSFLQ